MSVLGSQVTRIAFPLLVLGLTGSASAAGLVAAPRTLPYLLLTLPAGALVDRWNRRAVMVVCSAGSALALASVVAAYAAVALPLAVRAFIARLTGSTQVPGAVIAADIVIDDGDGRLGEITEVGHRAAP